MSLSVYNDFQALNALKSCLKFPIEILNYWTPLNDFSVREFLLLMSYYDGAWLGPEIYGLRT